MEKKISAVGAMKITEAAAAAGVSVRTLREYIYRELVSPAHGTTRNASYSQNHVNQAISAQRKIAAGQSKDSIALERLTSFPGLSHKIVQGRRKVVLENPSRVTRFPISASISIFLENSATRWEKELVQEMRITAVEFLKHRTDN